MVNKRQLSIAATLSGATAVFALLTGLSSARADDLQINQRLLDTRIDQLAAVGQNPGSGGAVFAVEQNPAAGAAVTAGSFPRSILIPGTDTSIKIYGQITEVLDYWMSGGNPNASPQTTTVGDNGQVQAIPLRGTVGSTRGNGIFSQTPKESKIGFETRTPTPFGEARTVFEFDWAGSTAFSPGGSDVSSVSDNLVPRLRYGYATLGGLLAGQATSNFSDPDANSETLDFGGNVGEPGRVRVPQVRWTMPAWWGASFSVSAETPETILATPNGIEASDAGVVPAVTTSCPLTAGAPTPSATPTAQTCSSSLLTSGVTPLNITKATAPDFTAAWYFPQPWGHFDISGVIQPGLDVTDGRFFDHQFIGYGGHIGMSFRPGWLGWTKDTLSAHFTAGDTLGPYLNSSGNVALVTNYGLASTSATSGTYGGVNVPATAANAALINFKTTQSLGAEVGYQHWWLANLRSNISGGFNAQNGIPIKLVGAAQAASLNKELITMHANLIWNPVSFVDVGLEYMWGQRTVLSNKTATENVLISKMAFRF